MPSNDDHKTAARAGARRIIEQAPKVLAGLFGISGVAYLSGSMYTRSYFSEFGASWILDEVPAAIYFSQSWIPLLLILLFGYLATTNLALIESQGDLTATKRFKVSVTVVQYGPWVLGGVMAITTLLTTLGYITPAIVLSVVAVTFILLLFSSALELLVVQYSQADKGIDPLMAYLSLVVIAAGLYVVPTQLGMNWARVDKQPSSALLNVYLRGDERTEYKLLFSVGERLYIFPTSYEGKYPPVKPAAAANVTFLPLESKSD
ncbi:MAG: hypothetical protein H8K04_00380 [Nitrospira sp.]